MICPKEEHFAGSARPRLQHIGEFGITVLKSYWNQGIGTAMVAELIHWAKASKVIRKINLRVRSDNHGAIHLYEKLGFIHEGLTTRGILISGQFYDFMHMGLEIN